MTDESPSGLDHIGEFTEMVPADYHVYPASEESLHNIQGGFCPCGPERKQETPEDGIVWVHRELKA